MEYYANDDVPHTCLIAFLNALISPSQPVMCSTSKGLRGSPCSSADTAEMT